MRLRRWKVERRVIVHRSGVSLPCKPEYFWTRRGAEKFVRFARRWDRFMLYNDPVLDTNSSSRV